MKGLLVKDFCILLQRKSFFLILALLTVFMSFSMSDGMFVIGWITMIMGIFSLSTLSYDEYDNCMPFLMSMPVSRRTYAAEKYLFGLLCGFSGWLFSAVIGLLKNLVMHTLSENAETILTTLIFLPLLLILLSCCIPVELKWGAERGRMYLLGIYGIFFAGIGIGMRFLPEAPAFVGKIASGLSFPMFIVIVYVLAILLCIASILLSIRITSKKEF